MKEQRIAAHVYDVLSRSAGDLSWQDDGPPPSCVPAPGLTPGERAEWYGLWDSAGPGKISGPSWTRIRRAVAVCTACPLRADCLAYASDPRHKVEGVWGGLYFPAGGRQLVAVPRVGQSPPEVTAA